MIKYRITGTKRIDQELQRFLKKAPRAVGRGLYELGERVMTLSVKLVPVDTGELKESAYVSEPVISSSGVLVEIGYGAEHAPEVHEDTSTPREDGMAKFLEAPVLQRAKGNLWRVAKVAREIIEKRSTIKTGGRFPSKPKGGV